MKRVPVTQSLFTFIIFLLGIYVFAFLITPQFLATANHVVISEIQISGTVAGDEFVELYNPTSQTISMTGWRLTRKTASGATQSNLVASMSGTIAPHGYILIANPSYDGSVLPDLLYSASTSAISADNTVLLYSDAGVTVVDKVAMGLATDKETNTTVNPGAEESIERKPGESDSLAGNGEDTDDNSADFQLRTVSEPQNSSSAIEPLFAPTPTITTTPSTTPIVTPSLTPTTTPVPTSSPTPTPTEVLTPTPTETPTPTVTPTPSPSLTPTATPTPTITVTPTQTPTATPTASLTPTPTTVITPTPTKSKPAPMVGPIFNKLPLPNFLQFLFKFLFG
jgi:hypothetical protein